MTISEGSILVVEDMSQIRGLLEVTLRFEGYPVTSASNGEEAMEIIAQQLPAMIITDILMPKMDGFALVYHLRKNPATRNIPVVFLSATYVTKEDKEFALSLGAVRFLEKPIDTAEFLLTIGEILTEGASKSSTPATASGWKTSCARKTSKSHAPSACSKPWKTRKSRPSKPC